MLRRMLTVTASVVVAVAGFVGTAQAGPASPSSVQTCGFYVSSATAWYNHCGTTNVLVRVDVAGGGSGNDYCAIVHPGLNPLGASGQILNAYYLSTGRCNI
ncbi:hypothetical protein EV186_103727 [Labedaea rhizosphaerae]|uniref:Alpha amylase inhibitor n=2 Tax=Labedaea rhizosphaerae TaxID=598644 RepID=A0A4R6SCU9_LABRH|nr:hypothetical protein EV186_103727 [Labedaea rhizosphaerae]